MPGEHYIIEEDIFKVELRVFNYTSMCTRSWTAKNQIPGSTAKSVLLNNYELTHLQTCAMKTRRNKMGENLFLLKTIHGT